MIHRAWTTPGRRRSQRRRAAAATTTANRPATSAFQRIELSMTGPLLDVVDDPPDRVAVLVGELEAVDERQQQRRHRAVEVAVGQLLERVADERIPRHRGGVAAGEAGVGHLDVPLLAQAVDQAVYGRMKRRRVPAVDRLHDLANRGRPGLPEHLQDGQLGLGDGLLAGQGIAPLRQLAFTLRHAAFEVKQISADANEVAKQNFDFLIEWGLSRGYAPHP
jgi:hypothetical protein